MTNFPSFLVFSPFHFLCNKITSLCIMKVFLVMTVMVVNLHKTLSHCHYRPMTKVTLKPGHITTILGEGFRLLSNLFPNHYHHSL